MPAGDFRGSTGRAGRFCQGGSFGGDKSALLFYFMISIILTTFIASK